MGIRLQEQTLVRFQSDAKSRFTVMGYLQLLGCITCTCIYLRPFACDSCVLQKVYTTSCGVVVKFLWCHRFGVNIQGQCSSV